MPRETASAKPDGWEKLRRHDDPEGSPEVGHDSRRHKNYTVLASGEIAWDDVPEDYVWRSGRLIPKEGAIFAPEVPPVSDALPDTQIVGTDAHPASISLSGEEA